MGFETLPWVVNNDFTDLIQQVGSEERKQMGGEEVHWEVGRFTRNAYFFPAILIGFRRDFSLCFVGF